MNKQPHNLDAEKGVIGSIILKPEVLYLGVNAIVRGVDFHDKRNQQLFGCLASMTAHGEPINSTSLVERLTEDGALEDIGGTAYLAEVMQSTPVAAHAEHYAAIVRDKAILRALSQACETIMKNVSDPEQEPRKQIEAASVIVYDVLRRFATKTDLDTTPKTG